MKRRLTDKMVRDLDAGSVVMDTEVPGFAVRVSPQGKRTFVLISRFTTNNPTRRALGTYPDINVREARERAREWRRMIAQGVDPKADRERLQREAQRKQANNFTAVAEDFFAHIKRQGQRRAADVERTVRRVFVAQWRDRPIADIDRFDVQSVIEHTVKRGKHAMAHLLLAYIRRLFNYAISREIIDRSPCDRLRPRDVIGERAQRDRVLTDDELAALWRAAHRIGYPFGSFVLTLMLTGQRRSEVAHMAWREVDLRTKEWTIPRERAKSKATMVVPLTDDTITLLECLPRFRGPYVFSHTFGATPLTISSKSKKMLDRAMTVELGHAVAFTLHDVRRSLRTGLSRLRVPTEVAEAVIGHRQRGLLQIYNQWDYLPERREALTLWAKHLKSIIEPTPDNVVTLRL
jgi:integrase